MPDPVYLYKRQHKNVYYVSLRKYDIAHRIEAKVKMNLRIS